MKRITLILLVLVIAGCKSKAKEETASEEITQKQVFDIESDGMNQLVPDEEDGGEMMLGKINREGISSAPFKEWFDENYATHSLDSSLIDSIALRRNDIKIKVFMGTWCEDSQREVPALFKILDAVDVSEENVELIALDHDKETPFEWEDEYEIEYVPTIMLMDENGEMNRIVEYPIGTLEQDLLMILRGEEYAHAYSE